MNLQQYVLHFTEETLSGGTKRRNFVTLENTHSNPPIFYLQLSFGIYFCTNEAFCPPSLALERGVFTVSISLYTWACE